MATTNSTKQTENLPTISMKNFLYNPPKKSPQKNHLSDSSSYINTTNKVHKRIIGA